MSNREIARHLGVNEASVRRGLKDYTPPKSRVRRGYVYVFEDGDVDAWTGSAASV